MSKSKGNGVDPDEMVDIYGADATALFVLFRGTGSRTNLSGMKPASKVPCRFLQRVWRFVYKWKGVLQRS
jgi:leucyl-tRNA synthetase